MRTLTVVLGLAATGFLATDAAGQQRPDFSGEWTLQAPEPEGRGARRGDFGSGWGREITVTQDAARLIVEWPFYSRGDLQPALKFVYALDGSRTTATILMGRGAQEQVSTAQWQGDRLVITTALPFTHPDTGARMTSEVTRTLSLESPATLVVETVVAGALGGPPTTTRTVYSRG